MSRSPSLKASLLLALLTILPLGCSGVDTAVTSEAATLGKVVVYRNGIAFYERRAHVEGDKLLLTVPADKVNDFLKSLTVREAKTGKALAVSFPTRRASRGRVVDMAIALPPPGPHDLVLSYITEAPAWKPSYRVTLRPGDQVDLQSWAIVDNTSGEDWKSVKVGVGSSSALAFRYNLRSVRRVHRETLRTRSTFAKAPPRGGSVYGSTVAMDEKSIVLNDDDIPKPVGHPDREEDMAAASPELNQEAPPMPAAVAKPKSPRRLESLRASGGLSAKATFRPRPSKRSSRASRNRSQKEVQMRRAKKKRAYRKYQRQLAQRRRANNKLQRLAKKLQTSQGSFAIEGYANPGESNELIKSLERANTLRNQLIAKGVAPGRLRVVGKGSVAGHRAGVRLVPIKRTASRDAQADNGEPVGESHFESQIAMTVKRQSSAMVPILQQRAPGEVVYLYDAEGDRGNNRFAFKAIRFRNPTTNTLESGPMTVYGSKRFVGEGLTEAIPPKAIAIIPFALDRQIVVEKSEETGDQIVRLKRIHRGVFTAEVSHLRTTSLELTNRMNTPARVFIRHLVREGWSLKKAPKIRERLGRSHIFEITIPGGQTVATTIIESTPLVRTLDLRSPTGLNLVRLWIKGAKTDNPVMKKMRAILALHAQLATLRQTIASLHQRARRYRERMDELHLQIFSLRAARTGGSLMRHLDKKMMEISERMQKLTLTTVKTQEKLMFTRIRFQDAAAELTLKS